MNAVWLREVAPAVLRRLAEASSVFGFLDYDGTLAPLAPTPDQAWPLPGTAPLLQQLVAAPGLQLAVVSGRTIADVKRFLDVPGLFYVGIHGLEIELPSGAVERSDGVAVVRSVLPAIKQQLQDALAARHGVLLEDKGMAIACHYRLASRADADAVRQIVAAVTRKYQRRGVKISLMHGHEVVEIRSAYVNKGKTALALLATHGPAALPVFIGDDQTDEDAFAALPPEAITIRVGGAEVPTRARFRIESPEAVHQFLRDLLDARLGRRLRAQPGLPA